MQTSVCPLPPQYKLQNGTLEEDTGKQALSGIQPTWKTRSINRKSKATLKTEPFTILYLHFVESLLLAIQVTFYLKIYLWRLKTPG